MNSVIPNDTEKAVVATTEKQSDPIRIIVIGTQGAGKSCFLAGLAIAGESTMDSRLSVTPTDNRSAIYVKELQKTLRSGRWPKPNTTTQVGEVSVTIDYYTHVQFLFLDYPGEELKKALLEMDKENFQTIFEFLNKSTYHFLLIDPELLITSEKIGMDIVDRFQALHDSLHEVAKERYLDRIQNRGLNGGIIISKSDKLNKEDIEKPIEFIEKYQKSFNRKVKSRFRKFEYFPISATGPCRSVEIDGVITLFPDPENLHPSGYDALFDWIVRNEDEKRNRSRVRFFVSSLATLTAFLIVFLLYGRYQQNRALNIISDSNIPALEQLDFTKSNKNSKVIEKRNDLFLRILKDIENRAKESGNPSILTSELDRLLALEKQNNGLFTDEIQRNKSYISNKIEEVKFTQIKDVETAKAPELLTLCDNYLKDHGKSQYAGEVREIRSRFIMSKMDEKKSIIRAMAVNNLADLKTKVIAIQDFVNEFGNNPDLTADEKAKISHAVELGKKFSETSQYQLRVKQSGRFTSNRWHCVCVTIGEPGREKMVKVESTAKSKELTWPDKVHSFEWRAGEPIKVELLSTTNYRPFGDYYPAAVLTRNNILAISLFNDQPQNLSETKEFIGFFDAGKAFVRCELIDFSADDWQAVSGYLFPGDKW